MIQYQRRVGVQQRSPWYLPSLSAHRVVQAAKRELKCRERGHCRPSPSSGENDDFLPKEEPPLCGFMPTFKVGDPPECDLEDDFWGNVDRDLFIGFPQCMQSGSAP